MKKFQSRSALLTLLVVGFVSLFAVGCGDSENFVFTGNNTPITGDTGNLVFRFTQAQTIDTVPTGTTSLRFDFFSSDTPSLATFLFTETRSYAELIIIEDVPVETQSVVVTAFGANGQPLAVLTGDVNVIIGADQEVDLVFNSNPTFNALTLTPSPAIILTPGSDTQQVAVTGTFDTAQVLGQQTSYTINLDPNTVSFNITENGGAGTTANITAGGLVQALTFQQNATLTAEFTAFGTTRSDSTLIRTVDFNLVPEFPNDVMTLNATDAYDGGWDTQFFESDGVTQLNVTSNSTFALQTQPTSGTITVDPTTGAITTTGAAVGTYNIVVTWTDGRTQNADGTGGTGTTFTDTYSFEVVNNS